MGSEQQQFCLKWNNHRSTILSVFDTLLEEESLVDVTLSAEGQFLRAHRVILSACSPYFRTLFRSSFLLDKAPVIVLKDVDFENLKALVEYMYKGEANVPEHMLQSFFRTAESLQIRGLAEGATKHFENESAAAAPTAANLPHPMVMPPHPAMPLFSPPGLPTPPLPFHNNKSKNNGTSGGGILAARLKYSNPDGTFPEFSSAADLMFPRQQQQQPPLPLPHHAHHPPVSKKRKSEKKSNKTPSKSAYKGSNSSSNSQNNNSSSNNNNNNSSNSNNMFSSSSNNNYDDDGDAPLKIDEDSDAGKENNSRIVNNSVDNNKDDDIVELDNGVGDSDEEEPSISGPSHVGDLQGPAAGGVPRGLINPWTGEDMSMVINDEHEDNSGHGDTGMAGWPPMANAAANRVVGQASSDSLGEFQAHPSLPNRPPFAASSPTPPPNNSTTAAAAAAAAATPRKNATPRGPKKKKNQMPNLNSSSTSPNGQSVRLKRLTNTDNVYTLLKTADGDRFRCKICHRIFNLKCTLLRHVRHQHQGRFVPHPCPQCGQVFKRTDHLKVHLKKIHNVETVTRNNRNNQSPSHNNSSTFSGTESAAAVDDSEPISSPSSVENVVLKTE